MTTTFQITAPDGTQYQVTGPDGATEDQALAQVKAQHQAAPASASASPANSGGIGRNFLAGMEEAPGQILTMMGSPNPPNIDMATGKMSPIPDTGGTLTKTIGNVTGLDPAKVTATTFPERAARAAGTGVTGALIPGEEGYTVGGILANAALGATSGAGAASGAEIANRSGHPGLAPLAAMAGGLVAPAAEVTATNVGAAGLNMAKNAALGFTGSAPEATVGKILSQAAGGSVPPIAEAPLPNMKPSIGQATGNSGLLNLERVAERTPGGEGPILAGQARSASNQAVSDAIDQLGSTTGTPSETMLNRLEAAQTAAKAATAAKWQAAGVDDSTPLPKPILQGRVNDYLGTLTTASRQNIPPQLLSTLDAIPADGATLGEIQDWRANIGDEARAAFRAGLGNKGRIIGGLQSVVGDFLDEAPTMPAPVSTVNGIQAPMADAPTEESLAAYKDARTATAQMKQRFGANQPGSPVNTALSYKEFGQAAPSNTADLFIKPNTQAGAPEAFQSYMKAIGDDPQGQQAARDAFAQKFQSAITGPADASGQPTIKPAAVSKFLNQYDHVINSDLFTDDQRDLMDRINKAAQMTNRPNAAASSGSPTYQNLAGKNWVDALVGAGANKVARTVGALGGAAAGAAGGGYGATFGAMAGAHYVPKVMESMLSANKEASMKLLTQALYDPDLAKTLMTNATPASASKIPLPLQARIFGVLLGKTANDNASRKVGP